MRFSLKRVLAAMAYVAIAAAAFTQDSWVYADLLWATALIAIAYAILVAFIARDGKRASAAGFTVFAICFLVSLIAAPESVPSKRILIAAGVEPGDTIVPAAAAARPANIQASGWASSSAGTLSYSAPLSVSIQPGGQAFTMISGMERMAPKIRAANAVGAVLFGLVGAMLGAVAWRRVKSDAASPPANLLV